MKKHQKTIPSLRCLIAGLAVLSSLPVARAHPYAAQVTNNSGTINFILNENADNVKVAFDNSSVTNDLGALATGLHSFPLAAHTNYAIIVFKAGAGVPTQLSSDTNRLVYFNSPRGVAVNLNSKSSNFGRVFVANSAAGSVSNALIGLKLIGDGFYVLNPDLSDAFGKGDSSTTGGVDFTTGGSSDPWKIGLGPDDTLYVCNAALTVATATTWVLDQNLTTNHLVFEGLGKNTNPTVHTDSTGTPVVRGSLSTSNLVIYEVDGSIPPWNSVVRWDIGAGPLPWNTAPVILGNAGIPSVADLNNDVDVGPDGKIYTSINRSNGTDVPSIKVFDTDGVTLLWDSMTAGGVPDPLRTARAIMVSPDGKYLASVHDDNHIIILPLINGIPDIANLSTISQSPTTTIGRDIAFDAADNVYTVSSGQALLRVFSLGLTTTCITKNDATGTNGTFQLATPATSVSVAANNPNASETGPTAGNFTITRTGADLTGPLTVNYSLTGTASNGVDYVAITNFVVIPANQPSVDITVMPIDDSISELTETVILTLKGGGSYSAVAPSTATNFIADNDPQLVAVSVTAANSMFERNTNDYATFRITRFGSLDAPSYDVTNFIYTGTAVANVDFYINGPVTIDPGVATVDFQIHPIDNTNYTGNKTVTIGLGTGTGYSVTAATASATIIDDEYPPEVVLFADSLISDTSSNNWKINFGANNLIDDETVTFGADLGVLAPAPNGASTALYMNVNKNDATVNGAAGVNLYALNQSFGGNYALRFDMNLVQNDGGGTTEFAIFGVNHSGTKTNWLVESGDTVNNIPTDQDGLWYMVIGDASGSAPADFVLCSFGGLTNGPAALLSASASSFTNVFKKPPYSADGGAGGPSSKTGNPIVNWSAVEVRQLGNIVRMQINKTTILDYVNTTKYTNGDIMIGYSDPYASIGSPDGGVWISNLRVVRINNPFITSTVKSGNNLNINFRDDSGDPVTAYRLLGSSALTTAYTNMNATITQTGLGTYSTSTSATNALKFFRIQHLQ